MAIDKDRARQRLDAERERLEDGIYGLCEACGQPIESDRLEALPPARYCVEDEVLVEHSVG
ncbi:MAG: TraR/DksA C4-type zinc finger protein [Acidimicrobiales bacterium]